MARGIVVRERQPRDWKVDLARRHPLESRVEAALQKHRLMTRLTSSTRSLERLDFQVLGPDGQLCEIELKAKHQRYNGWGSLRPGIAERDLFILDELALRKLLDAGRYAFLLVRDDPGDRWIVWSLMDLVFASKTRVSRQLATAGKHTKGKLLLNMAESPHHCSSVDQALTNIAELIAEVDQRWTSIEAWPTTQPLAIVGAAS
jgi:hypothetical protein